VGDDYDESSFHVFANNKELEVVNLRSASYSYRIEEVYEAISIRIEGIEKNDPMGTGVVGETEKVYTQGSTLYVNASNAGELAIFTVAGQLVYKRAVEAGTTAVSLSEGVYIVRLNEKTWKVVVGH